MVKKVKILDTTLRDGEQTPGVNLNISDKLMIAHSLEKLGVDIIEAGFPASSSDDFRAVQKIAEQIEKSTICALARAYIPDIDIAIKALAQAKNKRLHIFIATSDIHLQYKLKISRTKLLETVAQAITYAKKYINEIQFSAEDASRTDFEFLCEVYKTAIDNGAVIIGVPDTVGYSVPSEFSVLIGKICEKFPGIPVGVHCHNDLGLATANSISAVLSGASQIDCTVNGLGERTGNAALEEIVMAFNIRKSLFNIEHNINSKLISKTSKLVSSITGIYIPPNKPIIGKNVFVHDAGIHQHGVLENPLTYEIMSPQSIGLRESKLILGKLSGKHAFIEKLSELEIKLDDALIETGFISFKDLACRKKVVTDDDIRALIDEVIYDSSINDGYDLDTFQIQSGNKIKAMALVTLMKKGKLHSEAAAGEGPIDASFNAINKIIKKDFKLLFYNIKALTGGTDAIGEVRVRITDDSGEEFIGKGISTDIIKSSIKAYINAINRALIIKNI